jgi:GntR family transcriptional regulator
VDLRVNTKSHVPVRVQLEQQIKHQILSGRLEAGSRLPSIRELAGYLRINRNTVARAMAELERGGYVESRRGSGVFVGDPEVGAGDLRRQRLLERVMEQARAEGVSIEDLGYELLARAEAEPPESVPLLFVECNRLEAERFSAELEERLPARVEGVVLDELEERLAAETGGLPWRLAVTTFYHVNEVEQVVGPRGLETFALLTEPTLEGLRKLADLPGGAAVAVVGHSRTCTDNLMRSMKGSGLEHLDFFRVRPEEAGAEEIRERLCRARAVVCVSSAVEQVRELGFPEDGELIVQDRMLSKGGIEMLGRMLR